MAILIAEGFDDGVLRGSIDTSGGGTVALSTSNPRTGTRSVRTVFGTSASCWYNFPAHPSIASGFYYVGFCADRLPSSTFFRAFEIWDSVGVTRHLTIDLLASGKFRVERNEPGGLYTTLDSGNFVYTAGSYVGLCFEITIDNSVGVFKLYINGDTTPDIDFSGDTRNGGSASFDFLRAGNVDPNNTNAGATTFDFDDFVAQDTTGSAPENAFLGDVEVPYTFPTGDGDVNDWDIGGSTPAATEWESVDDRPPDEDVTTIETTVVGEKSRFVYGSIPTTAGPIYAVIPLLRGKKTAAGSREVRATSDDGTTEITGGSQALAVGYISWQPTVWHRDHDGNAWTAAKINASTFGPELTV